jgi:hypothetical protein
MGKDAPVNAPPDNSVVGVAREGADVVEQAGEPTKVGEKAAGETSEKDAAGEALENVDEERGEEGDKTKEGKPAKVGEKRRRETRGQTDEVVEQVVAEEEAGKEVKKAKDDEGEEAHHEGKKKRGRPAKSKVAKTKPASTEGKKRSVGRPRKATIATATGDAIMEVSGDPAHHTRSKDTTTRA